MLVINIGTLDAKAYDNIVLQASKKPNVHGTLYYLKDHIYLRKPTPTTNFGVWSNPTNPNVLATANPKLVIEDVEFSEELKLLVQAINKDRKGADVFQFKPLDGKFYIAFAKNLPLVPPQHELMYCIAVYGVFVQKSSQTAFLQMEVCEVSFKPIRLLGSWPSSSPQETNKSWTTEVEGENEYSEDTVW